VGAIIDGHQVVDVDLGVALGCAQAGVPEQLLNRPQVGAFTQQMGGKAVAQGMRGHATDTGAKLAPIQLAAGLAIADSSSPPR
jgi:hypothetical protein